MQRQEDVSAETPALCLHHQGKGICKYLVCQEDCSNQWMSDQGLNEAETCKGLDRAYPNHTRVITYSELLVSDKHAHL